jgi:hypothetical protein
MLRSGFVVVSCAILTLSLAAGCGSQGNEGGPVPDVLDQNLQTDDLACIKTHPNSQPADSTALSDALDAHCGCAEPTHIAGLPDKWEVVDCSTSTPACVNAVLDTNGFRNPPWSAVVTHIGTCAPLAVIFDPCGGVCRSGGFHGDAGSGNNGNHGTGNNGNHLGQVK